MQSDLNPTEFTRRTGNKISCSGHADLIQTPDGEWWAVFLATRPYEGEYMFNTGRETFMLPVTWKNGFPVILPKEKQIPTVVCKRGLTPKSDLHLTGNFTYNQDFNDDELDPSWIYIRTPQKDFHTIENGMLTITPLSVSLKEKSSPAAVLRRQQHTNYSVETQLDFTPKTENDFAGITLFQNEEHHFLFGKTIVDGKENLTVYRIEKNKETMKSVTLNRELAKKSY